MAKAKHAHTPSPSSPESLRNNKRLSGFYCNLDGALLSATAGLALLDLVAEREDIATQTGLCLLGIRDTFDSAIGQLKELCTEMGVASGDIADDVALAAPTSLADPSPSDGEPLPAA